MSEITSQATYAVKIYADTELVTDQAMAEHVLRATFGDQAVIRNRQADRWAISIADNGKLADAVIRRGFQKAFTRINNGTGVSWL